MQPFDPRELIDAARREYPEQPWIAEALSHCTEAFSVSRWMVHFVDPAKPNEPGSAWQFRENVTLESPADGDIVLDILKDGRVGAIEYLGRLLGHEGRAR
jgi:hypothetical protein